MMFVALIVLSLVAVAGAVLRFTALPPLAVRLALGVLGVAAAAVAWTSGVDAGVVGASLTCAVLAAFTLPGREASVSDLALAAAACGGLVVAASVAAPISADAVMSVSRVTMLLAAGTALAAAAGFLGRAALLSERESGGALWLAGAAVALLAVRRLSAYGPGSWTVNLPTVDAAGSPAFWLVDFGQGVPITLDVPDIGAVGLLCAGLLAVAGISPLPRTVRAVAGTAGGLAALVVVGWLLALNGRPVTIDPESVKAFLTPVAVAQALEGGARPLGQAPFLASVPLIAVPLAFLGAVGGAALTLGIAGLMRRASPARSVWLRAANALSVRDNLQWGALALCLGCAIFLVAGYDLSGVWGPARAGEHLLSAAALAAAVCAVGLHGLGGRVGPGWNWLRGTVVAFAIAALAAAIGGGLVSALGALEMS